MSKRGTESKGKDTKQSHGLLTTITAVLVLVEPHIYHHVTVLCITLCMGDLTGYELAQRRYMGSSPNHSQKYSKWRRKVKKTKWRRNSDGLEPNFS